MVTATRSETKPTKTVKRSYLLQVQVRNLLSRTTMESQEWLEKIGKGIGERWFRKVAVYGFDATNRCHAGLELEINWLTYTIEVAVWGEDVRLNASIFAHDECCPEVSNAVAVFNQAVNAECLRTAWRVSYAPGVDRERVRRELGLMPAPPLTWAGNVSQQTSQVAELPELKVRLLIAESDELVPKNSGKERAPDVKKPAAEPLRLFDRIKEAFGEV